VQTRSQKLVLLIQAYYYTSSNLIEFPNSGGELLFLLSTFFLLDFIESLRLYLEKEQKTFSKTEEEI